MSNAITASSNTPKVSLAVPPAHRCRDCEEKNAQVWAKAFEAGIALLLVSDVRSVTLRVVKPTSKDGSSMVTMEFK